MPEKEGGGGKVFAFLLVGVGVALIGAGIIGTARPTTERALFLIAGVGCIVAAVLHGKKGGFPKGSGDKPDGWPWWLS